MLSSCVDNSSIEKEVGPKNQYIEVKTDRDNINSSDENVCDLIEKNIKASLLKFNSVGTRQRIEILDTIENIFEAHKADIDGDCQAIFSSNWFLEYPVIPFIDQIKILNKEEKFNGFKFLSVFKLAYKNNAELGEYISEMLAELAFDSPDKFLIYLGNVKLESDRKKMLTTITWNVINVEEFKHKIKKSTFYNEIEDALKYN